MDKAVILIIVPYACKKRHRNTAHDAWMKSDPLISPYIECNSTSSSNTSKSDVTPHANIHIYTVEVRSIDSSAASKR